MFADFRDSLAAFGDKFEFKLFMPAIDAAIKSIDKYHDKATNSSAQVVCICKNHLKDCVNASTYSHDRSQPFHQGCILCGGGIRLSRVEKS